MNVLAAWGLFYVVAALLIMVVLPYLTRADRHREEIACQTERGGA